MSDTRHENKKSHYDNGGGSISSLFISALKSALVALLISVVLAAALCAAATLSEDPMSLIFSMSLATLYFSAFLSGLFCMRKMGKGSLLSGLFSGGLFMLMYMFISLFLPNEMSASRPFFTALILRSLIVVFSILGAYAGRGGRSRKRKIKR